VTNLTEFQKASEDSNWECSLLAKDLLKLPRIGLTENESVHRVQK
jgi:hypothetical protein